MKINRRYTLIAIVSTILVCAVLNRLYDYLYDSDALSAGDSSFISDTTRARILFQQGEILYDRNQFDSSLSCVSIAAEIYKKDSLWQSYVNCMNYVADNYRRLGKYDTAYTLLSENIDLSIQRLGEMNSATAMAINKLGLWYRDKDEHEKAMNCFNRALSIRLVVLPPDHMDIGWSHNNIGLIAYRFGEFDVALRQYMKALPIFKKSLGKKSVDLAQLYANIGSIYNITGYYDKALEYFNIALEMRIELLGAENSSIALLYNSLASVYLKQGDYPKASQLLKRALSIQLLRLGEKHPETTSSYYNLGFAHRGNGDHKEALKMFQKALAIRLQVFGYNHSSVASAYDEIGMEWLEQNENDSAIACFQTAFDIHNKRAGTKSFMRAYELSHIGSAYVNKEDYARAMEYYKEALEINLKFYGNKHEQVSKTYAHIAQVYLKKSDYTMATRYIKLAVESLVWKSSRDYSKAQAVNSMNLFIALETQGDIEMQYFEAKTHDPLNLREAFASYESALQLTDKIRREFTLQESKLMLGQRMSKVTEKAIDAAIALFSATHDSSYIQKAFLYSEKNKAAVLSEVLRDENAKSAAGIPDTLLLYERQLQARIGSYNKKLYIEQTGGVSSDNKIRRLLDNIFDATTEYEKHIQYIERQYPQYFELKYKPVSISLEEVQKILDDSTALIEYFVGNKKLFVFYVDKKSYICHESTLDSTIFDHIRYLRQGIENQNFELYSGSAVFLYESLLKNLKITGINHLIIIPDGPLASVPFEVLLTNPSKTQEYSDLDYLIKTLTISYAYSTALLLQKDSFRESSQKNLIGFSPSFFK